ncbi:MAG: penicillin-binding protein [Gammaproteobacteria bacterium]|nr:penicillin-binding protein [Gammaproteobacteria bacterium]
MHARFRRCNKLERFSVTKRYLVLISRICVALVGVIALVAFANVCAYAYLRPALPDVGSLRDVQLQVPLRVYTRDGRLIAAIGDQRRIPVRYEQLPRKLVQAFLATEDDRFFQHHGVDWQGILRAAVANLKAGGIRQGASTITMQVSRDMFLTPRRDMKRKMSEIYISLLMETEFTKEEIFSLYMNKIFLGQRSYGVAAAAEVYFGKALDQLNIAEMATLAGIPTAPSVVNPVASADAAKVRRAHVLGRMRELNYITQAEYDTANSSPMESRLHGPTIEVDAPYVAEMVRNEMQAKYGDSIYTAGYRVYTTVDSRLEAAATVALRTGLLEYDRRHGWRGATAKVDVPSAASAASLELELEEFPAIGGLRPAIVQSVEAKSAKVYVKNLGSVTLPWEKLSWARRELPEEKTDRSPTQASEILSRGDVIYTVGNTRESLQFVQVPEAQSALVSVDPKDGAVVALVGGFDFFQSKFNRVTQARRQPGSGFKPFVYAAAFDKGYTPASVVMDAPIVIDEAGMEQAWRPKEFEGKFFGPVRLRDAMTHSRNLVSVRLMREIGGDYTWHYVQRFGFDKSQLPNDLTMALGTASLSPLQMAAGYAIFANGGYRVTPYYIDRIDDAGGNTLVQAQPAQACFDCGRASDPPPPTAVKTSAKPRSTLLDEGEHDGKTLIPAKNLAPQVLRPQVAYLLSDMMADVIKHGTGMGARVLNRDDIAGKTGTTNDQHDAWFNGFNGDLVTTVWTGFDQDRSLGSGEQGAQAALPTWVYFMHEALARAPRHWVPVPDGIVTVRISPETGLLASADNPNGIMEKFIEGNLPKTEVYEGPNNQNPMTDGDKPLF